MKILQVNCVYNNGSTGKIMHDVHMELVSAGHKSVVCYGRGADTSDENVIKLCSELYAKANNLLSRITGILYGGCLLSTSRLISLIKREKPDVVHLHCINGFFVNIYKLVSWLKNNKIKTVVTLHAEFMYTGNCGHSYECERWKSGCGNCPSLKRETKSLFFDNTARSFLHMKNSFDGFNENLIVTSVSPWLMNRAKQSVILGDKKHTVVMNGLDTNVFYPRNGAGIREKLGIADKKVVLFVTPIFSLDRNHIKGGWYALELARRMPDTVFLIVGCREEFEDMPSNVINVGRINNQDELAKYYSAADVTLLASKRETFSMVLAESLCCGTPVVGFEAGGPESIALNDFCVFVEYGNIDALEKTLVQQLEKKYSCEEIFDISSKTYDKKTMTDGYINVYKELVGEGEN